MIYLFFESGFKYINRTKKCFDKETITFNKKQTFKKINNNSQSQKRKNQGVKNSNLE